MAIHRFGDIPSGLDDIELPEPTVLADAVMGPYVWDRKSEIVNKLTYDYRSKQWLRSSMVVVIDRSPFALGSSRAAYHMEVSDQQGKYVAKKSFDPEDKRIDYERDVVMQSFCQQFAEFYNAHNPPKAVHFIDTFLIERVDVPGMPVMSCEPELPGEYKKYNNNYGFRSDDDRNTPHSFSHFTWAASGGQYLIIDIQGVSIGNVDWYTDPQIHTPNLPRYLSGKGNLGKEGVDRFFATHKCNSICVGLGLSNVLQVATGTLMYPRPSRIMNQPQQRRSPQRTNSPHHRTQTDHRQPSPLREAHRPGFGNQTPRVSGANRQQPQPQLQHQSDPEPSPRLRNRLSHSVHSLLSSVSQSIKDRGGNRRRGNSA